MYIICLSPVLLFKMAISLPVRKLKTNFPTSLMFMAHLKSFFFFFF